MSGTNETNQSGETKAIVWPKPGVAWWMVAILVLAFIFSIADRIIISLLVDPIKADLNLDDADMGLLMGLYFALFYALMGLPVGRMVDKGSRRMIVASGIFLWSVMTAVCGLARNFIELFAARAAVGMGQAALSPAAYSMIADSFPKEKLGRALGVYQAGAFLGVGFALMFGGLAIRFAATADDVSLPLIGTIAPWQLAFIVIGLPGVIVAALMFTVKEPPRQGLKPASAAEEISIGQAIGFGFKRWRVFLAHYTGFALLALPMTTLATWVPVYFMRVVGMSPPEVGLKLGLIVLIFSPIGVIAGGWLSDTLLKKGITDAPLKVGVAAAVFMIPFAVLATNVTDPTMALLIACPFAFGASITMGLAATALQLVTPNRLRGQISAVWLLFLNIITAGLGPTAVGWVTEAWFGDPSAVGQSVAAVNTIAVILGGIILLSAWRPYREAVEKADDA